MNMRLNFLNMSALLSTLRPSFTDNASTKYKIVRIFAKIFKKVNSFVKVRLRRKVRQCGTGC